MSTTQGPPPILISACLAGRACRYDGTACTVERLKHLAETGLAIAVCPEELGGLPTPREPSEISGQRVISRSGQDVTVAFEEGAQQVLRLAQAHGITLAILKERSPSCGCTQIYDGSFSGRLIPGQGLTAALLQQHNLQIYTESNLPPSLK